MVFAAPIPSPVNISVMHGSGYVQNTFTCLRAGVSFTSQENRKEQLRVKRGVGWNRGVHKGIFSFCYKCARDVIK